MAQKQIAIGIKISSEGQEKVISNLQDLETELTSLQSKLKTLDFGSEAFKETTRNIQTLKTKIDDIDKSTEGLGAEKRFNAINASVGILVSSVQLLSGVIGVVIANTETLEQVQRAEATAVGILNTALGILQIRREIEDQQITALKIKEAALAGITKIATSVQAAFNAVLAANPIGLVIAGVVALTGAIYLLVKATSDETDAEEELNKQLEIQTKLNQELSIEAKKAAQENKIALSILTDNVKQRNLELKTIEDLKKTYPGFNAFLSTNNQLTAEGIEYLKIQIQLEEAQAKLKFLRTKQTDLEIKAQTDLNEAFQEQQTFLGDLLIKFKGGFNPIGQYTAKSNDLKEAVADENRELAVVNNLIGEQQSVVDGLLGKLTPLNTKLDNQRKAEELLAKQAAKTTKTLDERLVLLKKQTEVLNNYASKINDVRKGELKYESQLLDEQQNIIDRQEERLKKREDATINTAQKVRENLRATFIDIIPSDAELSKVQDTFKGLFDITNKILFQAKKTDGKPLLELQPEVGFDEFVKRVQEVLNTLTNEEKQALGITEDAVKGLSSVISDVNEETKLSFLEYFNTLDDRLLAIGDTIKNTFGEAGVNELQLKSINDLRALENQIAKNITERVNTGKSEAQVLKENKQLIAERLGIQDNLNNLQALQIKKQTELDTAIKNGDDDKIEKATQALEIYKGQTEALQKVVDETYQSITGTNDFVIGLEKVGKQSDKNLEKIKQFRADILKPIETKDILPGETPEQAKERYESALQGLKEYFKAQTSDFNIILTEVFSNSQEYFKVFGQDGIKALTEGFSEGLGNLDGLTRKELEKLGSYLQVVGDEFSAEFNIEENPFIKLIGEINKRLKKLPTEAQESFTKTIQGIKEVADVVLQVFNDILGQLNNIISAQNSLLLEQLQYKEEQALAIIGEANTESEKENKKIEAERAAAQKTYAKQRFDLEKKARVQELQFALASALSAGAGAVINALGLPAPPPIPQIYAGVIAGLTAAQVAVINDQIQFAQSKSFIGRRGGLIMGESHEGANGGVPALLEGGEFVVNKEGVKRFGDVISQINNSTGGRALTIDDSRIVQAIASQNTKSKQPLKAYVLYNDIQDTTKLNQKITQLARL